AISAEVLTDNNEGRGIWVRVTFRNTGLSWISFDRAEQKGVLVYELREAEWHPELEQNVIWGDDIMRSIALRDHHWVEPGEVVSDELLIPVGRDSPEPLAYEVVAKVGTETRGPAFWKLTKPVWTARTVIPFRLHEAPRTRSSEEAQHDDSSESRGTPN